MLVAFAGPSYLFSKYEIEVGHECGLNFKSARSGVTMCFRFVSVVSAAASAVAKTFASHVKTVWATS